MSEASDLVIRIQRETEVLLKRHISTELSQLGDESQKALKIHSAGNAPVLAAFLCRIQYFRDTCGDVFNKEYVPLNRSQTQFERVVA